MFLTRCSRLRLWDVFSRVLRDSDIEIEEEAGLVREFEILLKQRRRGRIVRLKIEAGAPDDLKAFFVEEIGAEPNDVVEIHGIMGMTQLSQLITDGRPDLLFKPYEPRFPERIREFGGDIFAATRVKDILVHHPMKASMSRPVPRQAAGPGWSRSSRRSTAPRRTHPSSPRWSRRRKPARTSRRWSN